MNGPTRTVSSMPPTAPKTRSGSSQALGRLRWQARNVQTARVRPSTPNMTSVALLSAESSPSKPRRMIKRAATLIANNPTASATGGNQRCCLMRPSPGNPCLWHGIVTPGDLPALDLPVIFADDAPRVLGGKLGVRCELSPRDPFEDLTVGEDSEGQAAGQDHHERD